MQLHFELSLLSKVFEDLLLLWLLSFRLITRLFVASEEFALEMKSQVELGLRCLVEKVLPLLILVQMLFTWFQELIG